MTESELAEVCGAFKTLRIPKDRHLLKRGQYVHAYYFIQTGVVRVYFARHDQESTAWFAFENEFFTDLVSLRSGLPTQYHIQALENCDILYIDHQSLEQLYEDIPQLQKFGRLIWETAFVNVMHGIIGFQTMSAKERYLHALQNPDLMQRVPLQYLASYLGITKTSLSRLRREITKT